MKLRIKESSGGTHGTFYKNVDICDLKSILSKGILSLNRSGNDNWDSGRRVNNSRDVVYLFVPTGYENSFVQYGLALLEVEVDGVENELLDGDVNKGKYIEYVCDCVPPENIRAVYIPKIFRDQVHISNSKIKFVDMEAKIFSSELYDRNLDCYGVRGFLGCRELPRDFDDSSNYIDCNSQLLKIFSETANVIDSSMSNYFVGQMPDRTAIHLKYIHYDIPNK